MDTNGPSGNRKVSTMFSRPPTLNENDNRRRGLSAVSQPPVNSMVEQTGVSSSRPPPLPPSALTAPVPRSRLPSSFIRPPSRSPHHPISLASPSPFVVPPPFVSSRPSPPVNRSLSTYTPLSSLSPPPANRPSPPPRVSHLSPSSQPSPPSVLAPRLYHPPSFSSDLLPPHANHHSPVFSSPPPSSLPSPASSSSVHIPHPSTILPPSPPPPHCTCSSLLPRLLSAHRLEVRRLLRGALASIGRRLDVLERRSRKKKKKMRMTGGGGASSHAPAASSSSTAASSSSSYLSSSLSSFPSPSSSISAFFPLVSPSSSPSLTSDSEDSSTSPPHSCFNQSEQTMGNSQGNEEEKVRGRKRRRRNRESDEMEEKDVGRFVGQMAVSFREGGAKEEGPITLHNFNHRKHRRAGQSGQSEKSDSIVRHNGFRPLLLHSILGSSSQDDIHHLQSAQSLQTCSHSDATTSQLWLSNLSAFGLWLRPSSASFNPASLLRLSAVALDTMMDSVKDGTCLSPLRPLRDWTAPPSVGADHCYMRAPSLSLILSSRRQHKQRSNRSTRSLQSSWRRPLPPPPCPANGLTASFTASTTAADPEFDSSKKEHGKRVSQIRIRRASPRETSLTPMGLPKVKRIKKKEFSLEEIYTNKNYKSPSTNRSLETIFEEPRGKNGALLLIGHQRRRRVLLFPDFTQPRKRKRPQGAWFPGSLLPRKRAAARRHLHGSGCSDDDLDLDVMLVERLSALEDFLLQQGLDV